MNGVSPTNANLHLAFSVSWSCDEEPASLKADKAEEGTIVEKRTQRMWTSTDT